jgi:hypothetical protein
MQHRSEYDNNMNIAWQYNTQPWPGPRTQQDVQLQTKFCGRCPNSGTPPQQVENYEPLYGFRTPYDMELQSRWCGTTCQYPIPIPVRPIPIPVRPIPIPVRPIPTPVRPIPIPVRPIPIPVRPIPTPVNPYGPITGSNYGGVMSMSPVPVYNYACNRDHSSGGANSYASY